jgi:hypothetical protein
MHAAFPRFSREINQIMQLGAVNSMASELMDRVGGRFLAGGMAQLLKFGFGFLMLNSIVKGQPEKAEAFFNDNFIITDSTTPEGKRYYQGKFLIRTKKPDDDMNVLLKFCPQTGKLYKKTHLGTFLDPFSVITTITLNENQADRIEKDPDQVDLIIRFKDVESIKGLLKQPDVDMAGMLLDNVVQITGNLGHLFKLGAIAQNVKREVDLPKL